MLFTKDVLFVSYDTRNLGDSLNTTVRQDTKVICVHDVARRPERKRKAYRVQAPSFNLAEIELYRP